MISSWKNESKYIALVDSCESQIMELQSINKIDSVELYACNELNNAQGLLINAHKDETQELKSDLNHQILWRRFWKTTTGIVSVVASSIILYQSIKWEH